MSNGKLFALWLVLIFIEVLFVALVVSPEFPVQARVSEKNMNATLFGTAYAKNIEDAARHRYKVWLVDSGFIESTTNMLVPKRQDKSLKGLGNEAFSFARSRLSALWALSEACIYRFTLMMSLLPFALPLIAPALLDAFVTRDVRKQCYGYASPSLYHFGKTFLVSALFFPIFAMIYPFTFDPVLWVVWVVFFPLFLWLVISNVQNMV